MSRKNMTGAEWNDFCAEKGLDPATGGKMRTIYKVDYEQMRKDNDQWLLDFREYDKSCTVKKKLEWPKWRLKWVKS